MLKIALSSLKNRFPSISRFITEAPVEQRKFYSKIFVISFVSSFLLVAIGINGFTLFSNINQLEAAGQKREQLLQKQEYWNSVVEEHSGYRDGYFQLALVSYQLNEVEKTREYLKEALTIDPNFQAGKEFLTKLEE